MSYMSRIYARLIKNSIGNWTLENIEKVPVKWREEVRQLLTQGSES